MAKYKVHERPRVKKKLPKMKPKDEYPPKYKVYRRKRARSSASRKKCC